MQTADTKVLFTEKVQVPSSYLGREVEINFYLPVNIPDPSQLSLLLINDGQLLEEMHFPEMLAGMTAQGLLKPIVCVGIHAGADRKMEYGVAAQPDYMGRGARAGNYTSFVLTELIPFVKNKYCIPSFSEQAMAGFSLGGLMALDIVWNHPGVFSKAGVFSGSFWWRSLDQANEQYDDDQHRIMQQQIRKATYHSGLKFFLQCGNKDETHDRNNNGIIDSIDDTLAIINELVKKGYDREKDICYLEMPDGKHDPETWGKAMPAFLQWGWGVANR
jgi:enterochelin esterase-like enzyme